MQVTGNRWLNQHENNERHKSCEWQTLCKDLYPRSITEWNESKMYRWTNRFFTVVMNMLMWKLVLEHSNNEFPVYTTLCSWAYLPPAVAVSWVTHEHSLRNTMLQHLLIGYIWYNSYISTLLLIPFPRFYETTQPVFVRNVVFCKLNN